MSVAEEDSLKSHLKTVRKDLNKWDHYWALYEKYFGPYRKQSEPIRMMEIGVAAGGSLELWISWFGGPEKVHVYGVDIQAECQKLQQEIPGCTILIGDQGNREFLEKLCRECPPMDIIIDDGGHMMHQQNLTFEVLFTRLLKPGGMWLTEDVHTSYWPYFGGNLRRAGTFIETSKGWVDHLHAPYQIPPGPMEPSSLWANVAAIHFHDSMVFVEKHSTLPPIPTATVWRRGQAAVHLGIKDLRI